MIRYRPFLNCDPPALAKIWRGQAPNRALVQPMTAVLFDELVLAKPFFDPAGLIVAEEDGQLFGFVHAGFGPSPDGVRVAHREGATSVIMTRSHARQAEIAQQLLARGEDYLRQQGAEVLYGGSSQRRAPFYLGLYGGSGLAGIVASDTAQRAVFERAGYREAHRQRILHRDLAGFRPAVDRDMMRLRRQLRLARSTEFEPADWWDAGTWSRAECLQFGLYSTQQTLEASATFWDIEPLASSWGVRAAGLIGCRVPPGPQQARQMLFLLGEVLHELQTMGTARVELMVDPGDTELLDVCQRLGLQEVDQGITYIKPE